MSLHNFIFQFYLSKAGIKESVLYQSMKYHYPRYHHRCRLWSLPISANNTFGVSSNTDVPRNLGSRAAELRFTIKTAQHRTCPSEAFILLSQMRKLAHEPVRQFSRHRGRKGPSGPEGHRPKVRGHGAPLLTPHCAARASPGVPSLGFWAMRRDSHTSPPSWKEALQSGPGAGRFCLQATWTACWEISYPGCSPRDPDSPGLGGNPGICIFNKLSRRVGESPLMQPDAPNSKVHVAALGGGFSSAPPFLIGFPWCSRDTRWERVREFRGAAMLPVHPSLFFLFPLPNPKTLSPTHPSAGLWKPPMLLQGDNWATSWNMRTPNQGLYFI